MGNVENPITEDHPANPQGSDPADSGACGTEGCLCSDQQAVQGVVEEGGEVFGEDYFMRGLQSGVSNYENYRWLPDLTLPMADQARWLLDIRSNDRVLDFGCSRGFFVKALRLRGIDAYGYDISKWAIANCDPAVRGFVSNTLELPDKGWDFLWSKDCMEHAEESELEILLPKLLKACRKTLFIIVPLALTTGGPYGSPVDEADKTHKIRWPIQVWLEFLQSQDENFVVQGGFQMPGLKPGCYLHNRAYGFFTMRRIRP